MQLHEVSLVSALRLHFLAQLVARNLLADRINVRLLESLLGLYLVSLFLVQFLSRLPRPNRCQLSYLLLASLVLRHHDGLVPFSRF